MCVLGTGIALVPSATRSTGPWLDGTRATSLARVANRPIVCHVLDALRDAGLAPASVVVPEAAAGELQACLAPEPPSELSTHSYRDTPGGALRKALLEAAARDEAGPCVLHRADGLLGAPLSGFLEALAEGSFDALLLVGRPSPAAPSLRVVDDSSDAAISSITGVGGACILGAGALRAACALGLHESDIDLTELAASLASEGVDVKVHAVPGWRRFAGVTRDLLDLNRAVLDTLEPAEAPEEHDNGNSFEGRLQIDPTATIIASTIVGPVVVGADAKITDSYIGPHTSIGERVQIDGAEIERSIVLADARVLHVGGRLTASVVGRDARIFRDFSVPRALRLQIGDGDEVALC